MSALEIALKPVVGRILDIRESVWDIGLLVDVLFVGRHVMTIRTMAIRTVIILLDIHFRGRVAQKRNVSGRDKRAARRRASPGI